MKGTDWGQRKMGHNAQNLSTGLSSPKPPVATGLSRLWTIVE